MEEAEEENKKMKQTLSQLKTDLVNKTNQIAPLQKENKSNKAKITQLNDALAESQKLHTQLEQKYNALEAQYNLLKNPPKTTTTTTNTNTKDHYTETLKDVSFKMIKIPNKDFYMAETQVTQALWQAVMGGNPSRFEGKPQNPVENVSWNDIVNEFLPKLNKLTGKTYRLPTEAEWEYAAKGGANYKYAGSDNLIEVGWYDENANDSTQPVKQKKPNGYGLYDMSGNVWEWCQDWYDSTQQGRVLRGGSWFRNAADCRVADRNRYTPASRNAYIGLRLLVL